MAEYEIRAKVDQIVTKEIRLSVVADSDEEALEKSRDALQTYPAKHDVVGIRRIQTEKATYWIPRDIEFIEAVRMPK